MGIGDYIGNRRMEQLPRHSHTISQRVTENEIEDIIKSTKSWKASGEDNIPTGLLKACGKPLHKTLIALITSSFNAAYFPRKFKIAKVTVLPKPNKIIPQKATPGAWRLISLLNIIGKIVKAAFARRITNVAKAKHLLPDGQMGNRRGRLTDLAIRIIIEAAIEARKNGGIASLLQLDIKKAFNAVHY
jgi:hypothetical protein